MKPNLLLLHGALGSSQQLAELKSLLSDNYSVHSINFEGHGGLPSSTEFSIDLFVKNTLDYLRENSIEQTSIFGYSMGGYVALKLALEHPEKVEQICTLGTKFNWSKEAAEKEIKLLNPEIIEAKVPKFVARLNTLHQPEDWKNVVLKTAQMMRDLANGKALKTSDFSQISHKVCIGIGTEDQMVSMEESQEVALVLPNGKLEKLEGIPHPIDLIAAKILKQFIENQFQNY
tara:strand:+ start:22196 stop:22888 length:693 start_codon:yes stop_codon:yes gene_type:complete